MKNLENYQFTELNSMELRTIEGGFPPAAAVALAVAIGGACAWFFEKGEQLGKAMA